MQAGRRAGRHLAGAALGLLVRGVDLLVGRVCGAGARARYAVAHAGRRVERRQPAIWRRLRRRRAGAGVARRHSVLERLSNSASSRAGSSSAEVALSLARKGCGGARMCVYTVYRIPQACCGINRHVWRRREAAGCVVAALVLTHCSLEKVEVAFGSLNLRCEELQSSLRISRSRDVIWSLFLQTADTFDEEEESNPRETK